MENSANASNLSALPCSVSGLGQRIGVDTLSEPTGQLLAERNRERSTNAVSKPARWWIGTVPYNESLADKITSLQEPLVYAKGQEERGARTDGSDENGFHHWQMVVCSKHPIRLSQLRSIYGPFHFEPTRSAAALEYVWKEDTAIAGTRFEIGQIPLKRNSKTDWDKIKQLAMQGKLDEMDSQIYVCHYGNLKRIAYDNLVPQPIVRTVNVYWGSTGVGKSRRAWDEAGMDAYPKDPRTKFWDGYRNHRHVVMDEFRGDIDIAHLLRWFDRYPVNVEIKGSAVVLSATTIWITSNLPVDKWYPNVDETTLNALKRRLNVVHVLDQNLQ